MIIKELLDELFKGGRVRDFSANGITNISVVINDKTLRANIRRLNNEKDKDEDSGS